LKRSNRLIMLIGVFLAIVAFIGILLLMQGGGPEDSDTPPTTADTVLAAEDIPLGSVIQADQLKVENLPLTARNQGAFESPTQVVGKIAREAVVADGQITAATLEGGSGAVQTLRCPAGLVCMSVQVDQVTGVGTVIQTGDYVDMIVGFTGDKFPVITLNAIDDTFTVVSGINNTSVKALLQGMQVVGTLLPPPPAEDPNAPDDGTEGGSVDLNGQQQIVILAVDTQQAEIIKFAQLDGSISLVLRSPDDFVDPTTGDPIVPVPNDTSGIILKTLVDSYGVLPPELVETILPEQDPTP
jgi:Flp pilus assembly protein CpaB